MRRAELAEALRNWGRVLQDAASDEDGSSVVRLTAGAFDVLTERLDSAAAALEEEDKDARRYRSWKATGKREWRQGRLGLELQWSVIIPLPQFSQRKEISEGEIDRHIDAALDAWIKDHG